MFHIVVCWICNSALAAKREVRELSCAPGEILFCIYLPVVWILVVWGLLGDGMMTRLPVGFVDLDKTSLTREIGRSLDSNRSISLKSYPGYEEAASAMRNGAIYAVIAISPDYTREMQSGRGSAIELYLDETRFAVAGTLQFEIASTIGALNMENQAMTVLRIGNGVGGAARILAGVHSTSFALGNAQDSFLAFLGAALLPGVIMVSATLGFITALVRETWQDSEARWIASANGSISAALIGKMLPHMILYCLIFSFYMALFAGEGGFIQSGSLLIWFLLGAFCLAAFCSMAIFIVSVAPNWRSALVLASGYAAPALPFTGFSIPLDSMGEYVRAFSLCLPLTWYIEGQAQQWTLDSDLGQMWPAFCALALLGLIPLILGTYLFYKKYNSRFGN